MVAKLVLNTNETQQEGIRIRVIPPRNEKGRPFLDDPPQTNPIETGIITSCNCDNPLSNGILQALKRAMGGFYSKSRGDGLQTTTRGSMQTNTQSHVRHPSGRRSIPDALIHALKAEQTGQPLPKVKKGQLTLALKGARSALGVSRATIDTLCLLIGLVNAEVFESGARPIVNASNCFLAYEAGICVRALQARISAAIAAGLLIPVDSPDMKRLTRTHDGKAERYGFDLPPPHETV